MRNWMVAAGLSLSLVSLAGCKEQANPADTAKNNPQLGTPSAAGGPAGTVTGGSGGTMQRQTAAGTPGGPTDDLGPRPDAGASDAGADAGTIEAGSPR